MDYVSTHLFISKPDEELVYMVSRTFLVHKNPSTSILYCDG